MRPALLSKLKAFLTAGPAAWCLWGAGLATAGALAWAGITGAFFLLALVGITGILLVQKRLPGRPAAVAGLLAALDVFVISLWISPPCDPDTFRPQEAPGGSFQLACDPQEGMGTLALWALLASLAVGALLWLLARERRKAELRSPSKMDRLPTPALFCTVIAVVAAAAVVLPVLSVNQWSPTALVRMSVIDPVADLATEADPSFKLFSPQAHYDGVYFYTIGVDPLALGEAHRLIDLGEHRYTHPLYGWLAWLLSVGQSAWVPGALLAIGVASMAAAAYLFSRLASSLGYSAWWGLVVPLNPGLLASVSFDTAEPLAAAILAGALLTWFRGRVVVGGILLLLLCFARQPLAIVPIALGVVEIVKAARGNPSPGAWGRLALLATGPAAMVLWQVYLRSRFGVWSFETAGVVLTVPFEGWAHALRLTASFGGRELAQVGLSSLPLLVATLTLILLGISVALRSRSPLAPVFLGLALVHVSMSEPGLVFPKDLLRFSAIPWLIVPFLLTELGATDRPSGRKT